MVKYTSAPALTSGPTPTRTSGHRRSIGSARDDILRNLVGGLGKKAVAAIFRVSTRTVDRWLKSTEGMDMERERRLRDVYQVFDLIEKADDAHVARAWFLGMNPHLRDRSPIEVLADGDARRVVAAARAYLNEG